MASAARLHLRRNRNWGKMMKMRATLLLILAGLALTACNTVQGLGRDLSSAGDAVSDAAK